GVRPGLRRAIAARSTPSERAETKLLVVAAFGRGIPAGGIMPACSLRITFSTCSEVSPGFARSTLVKVNPPDFNLSLWHPAQYCFTSACCAATVIGPVACAGDGGAVCCAKAGI